MNEVSKSLLEYWDNYKDDETWNSKNEDKEKLRKKFVSKFSAERIAKLTKEEYAIGNNDHSTFSYQIEFGTESLGKMSGATAGKFGIYFGTLGDDTEKKWRIGAKRFGNDVNAAFELILTEIRKLVLSKSYLTKKEFDGSLLSPMLRSKILYLYHPDLYLPVYSKDHLALFCDELALLVDDKSHYSLHKALLDYKYEEKNFSKVSNMTFMTFLYDVFRTRISEAKNSKDSLVTKKVAGNIELIDLEDIGELGNLELSVGKGKGDYISTAKEKTKVGLIGEKLIYENERDNLEEPLKSKVKHESLTDDSLGYDILSYDESGQKVYIEVKTTRGSFKNSRFFISENEKRKAEELQNYYIYFLSNIKSSKPKLIKFKYQPDKVNLQPTNYMIRVEL